MGGKNASMYLYRELLDSPNPELEGRPRTNT
jgi:hypothetical protein